MNLYAYAGNDPVNMVDPTGEASVIASALRLTATGMKEVARLTREQAIRLREAGGNVLADSRQAAKQIETAAHGKENLLKHKGHDLPDGSIGKPHFQTDGVKGHTFWSVAATALTLGADVVNNVADFAEMVDPTTYLTSGNSYTDAQGNPATVDQLINRSNGSNGSDNAKATATASGTPSLGRITETCTGPYNSCLGRDF